MLENAEKRWMIQWVAYESNLIFKQQLYLPID